MKYFNSNYRIIKSFKGIVLPNNLFSIRFKLMACSVSCITRDIQNLISIFINSIKRLYLQIIYCWNIFLKYLVLRCKCALLIRTSEQARGIPWRANALGWFYHGNSISSRRNIQSSPFVPFIPLVPFIIHLIVSTPT